MKDIIKNYSLNLGYQVIILLIPFISIPYLSRTLGPNNLGVEAYTTSVTAVFIAVVNAGTLIYSTRQVASLKNKKELLIKEVYNIILFRVLLAFGSLLVYFLMILQSEYFNVFLIQSVFLIASTFFDCTWYFIGKENFKLIVFRNLLIKFVGILLILQFVNDQSDLINYIWINAVTVLIPNISLILLLIKDIGMPKKSLFSIKELKKLIFSIYPFFIMGIITQVYMNVDKIIIEKHDLIYELGVYSQFIKSYSVFLAPITAVGTILMPRITNLVVDKKENGTKLINFSSNFIFVLCIPIFTGLIAISNEFVKLFYGEGFSEFLLLFQIGALLIFTGSLSNIVVQQVIYPNSLEKLYNKALVYASLIRIIIILISINIIGIYGALIAYVISELILMGICIYSTRSHVNIINLILNFNNLRILSAGATMFVFIKIINENMLVLKVLGGSIVYIVMLVLLKEQITIKIKKHITSISINKKDNLKDKKQT
ncbi:oligosaccharide flippase family protein [Priestia flexa]|uniref:oligosaccharide flippase family protein n=1 Tax=Priestia flexa TaxID=86664 RepID=UPI0024C05D5E|nr:oligosaccharide flippase family protein [Priestia flexa]WHX80024.1 oligosaccharide flippase family protein [Priestia flexa]